MRSLTTDRNLIVSAIERSSLLQVRCQSKRPSSSDDSDPLQLSSDRDMVCRVSPLYTPSEDEVTRKNCLRGEYKSSQLLLSITIPSQESLPPQSTHDQLQRLFKTIWHHCLCQVNLNCQIHNSLLYKYNVYTMQFTLYSLPRYKPSGNIKGFAFIEFSTSQEAHSTVEVSSAWRHVSY